MKKVIALLLSLSFVLCAAACSSRTENPDQNNPSHSDSQAQETTIREGVSDGLDDVNYDGRTFYLFGHDSHKKDFMIDADDTAEPIDDQRYKRNRTVEERFGITIQFYGSSEWSGNGGYLSAYMNEISNLVASGDQTYDMISGDMVIYDLFARNLYVNWNTLDVDFSKPWWAEKFIEEMTLCDICEYVTGDYSTGLWSGMWCFYFNKMLSEKYNTGDLYAAVDNNQWTLETVTSLSKDIYDDLNGSTVVDASDAFCLLLNDNSIDSFLTSCNAVITKKDSEGFPEYVFNCEHTYDVATKVYELVSNSKGSYYAEYADKGNTVNMFMADQSLMFASQLAQAQSLRNMDSPFGILPYPKFDENQEEYITYSGGFDIFAIPSTAKDPQFSADILTALMAESYKKVIPAYYDLTLKGKVVRDDESESMLDLMRDTIYVNFGTIADFRTGNFMYRCILRYVVGENLSLPAYLNARVDQSVAALEELHDILEDYD